MILIRHSDWNHGKYDETQGNIKKTIIDTSILNTSFFSSQQPYRIILGPPKYILHLVCSVLGISTAIKTALKVELYDFFDGPPAPLNGQLMKK